jgi:hypothetical protein
LDKVLINKISEFVGRQLQTNVPPDRFYKSDIANDGGDMTLRMNWIRDLSEVLKADFGLKVEHLEFGRGHDPIRGRFAQLLNVNETYSFDRELITAAGQKKTIRIIILYQVLGASEASWDRFQNKALIAQTERAQLDEVRDRIKLLFEFAFQQHRFYEIWKSKNFTEPARERLRKDIMETIAREYGLVIEIAQNALFTIEIDQDFDPGLQRLLKAREEIEAQKIAIIQRRAIDDEAFEEIKEELQRSNRKLDLLNGEIDKAQKKFLDNQLQGTPFEGQLLAQDPGLPALQPPSPDEPPASH